MIRYGLIFSIFSMAHMTVLADVTDVYKDNCASCHGDDLKGGMAPSMLSPESIKYATTTELTHIIETGDKSKGMPGWKGALSGQNIQALAIFIQEKRHTAKADIAEKKNGSKSAELGFDLVEIAEKKGTLWSMDFLPDTSILTTHIDGQLYHLTENKINEVKNTPKVWRHGQGGLLDVRVHPDYEKNGWIYLSLSESTDGKKGSTKVVRGRLKSGKWVGEQTVFSVPLKDYGTSHVHFGSRIEFIDDYLFFGIGDRGVQDLAQDLSSPNGKIFRLHDDGRIPSDNPFVGQKGALPEIWSYGHRNPQGMTLDGKGRLWNAEHGPRGGDEINHVRRSINYGWPVITYGMNYNGTPITDITHHPDMAQPAWYWVPSIAVSDIEFYQGDVFPEWQGRFLAASLRAQELQLLDVDANNKVNLNTVLLKNKGRIRDVHISADGFPYLILVEDKISSIVRLEKSK